ncbi:MAG: aldehyde:ferredoxin oxidoreductase [Deltaproteobacteria bacterium]|nr:aldehyde:ferredoxin oxidoreductase [Deltaproteobacteria bacterium]
MKGGFTGKILRLNLTDHTTGVLNTSDYEEYGGGLAMGTAVFWDRVEDKSIDAFDPRNVITVMGSPLSGTLGFSASGRTEVNGIGPQAYPIGWFTRSNFGGRFGAEVKYAGWDGLVIEGKSDSPVWVKIVNDRVTFEDAGDLWGLDTYTTQEKIWEKASGGQGYGDWLQVGPERDAGRTTQRPAVLCIGPIGEVQARDMGCLIHDAGNAAGQGGFGAVWGSKNLKAISVTGTGSVAIADPQALMAARLWAKGKLPRAEDSITPGPNQCDLQLVSTPGNAGLWPKIASRPQSCIGCEFACRRRQASGQGNESGCLETVFYSSWVNKKYGSVTDETSKAADAVQRYGANVYPILFILPYLYRLYKMGVLGPGKAIHTDLPFDELGSVTFLEKFFEKIIKGEDIGLDLREGIVRAAEKWGRLEEDLASGLLQFPYWGYPEHGYDGRGSVEWGYSSILGDRDTNDHDLNTLVYWYDEWFAEKEHRDMFVPKTVKTGFPVPLETVVEKWAEKLIPFEGDPQMLNYSTENMYSAHIAKTVAWQRYYSRFWKQGVGFCDFAFPDFVNTYAPDMDGLSPEAEPKFYNAVTGKNITYRDGMEIGRKVWNINNAIWALQGRHREMVKFADYYYTKPIGRPYPAPVFKDGKWSYADMKQRHIDRDKFEGWKTLYYRLEGWDEKTGWPKRRTLEDLGLKHVADELDSKGKLGADT